MLPYLIRAMVTKNPILEISPKATAVRRLLVLPILNKLHLRGVCEIFQYVQLGCSGSVGICLIMLA